MSSQSDIETMNAAWRSYAKAYRQLLGDGWRVEGWTVTNGTVRVDARSNEIDWLDLAPDGEPRETRTVRLPSGASIGAIVAVTKTLAAVSSEA